MDLKHVWPWLLYCKLLRLKRHVLEPSIRYLWLLAALHLVRVCKSRYIRSISLMQLSDDVLKRNWFQLLVSYNFIGPVCKLSESMLE